jgi:hypothetical protein
MMLRRYVRSAPGKSARARPTVGHKRLYWRAGHSRNMALGTAWPGAGVTRGYEQRVTRAGFEGRPHPKQRRVGPTRSLSEIAATSRLSERTQSAALLVRNQRYRAMLASFSGWRRRDVLMVMGARGRIGRGAIHDEEQLE